jgi:hypothetical protein
MSSGDTPASARRSQMVSAEKFCRQPAMQLLYVFVILPK